MPIIILQKTKAVQKVGLYESYVHIYPIDSNWDTEYPVCKHPDGLNYIINPFTGDYVGGNCFKEIKLSELMRLFQLFGIAANRLPVGSFDYPARFWMSISRTGNDPDAEDDYLILFDK